eukprot:scaffold214940_cov35-Attheya_sp.AAC.1
MHEHLEDRGHLSPHEINDRVDRERKLQHERWEQEAEARAEQQRSRRVVVNVVCSFKLLGVRGVCSAVLLEVRGVRSSGSHSLSSCTIFEYAVGGLQHAFQRTSLMYY